MTDQEIKDLARKYAEENPPQTEDEVLKQNGIGLNAKMVFEPFLRWLTKTHCIVSREKVISEIKAAQKELNEPSKPMLKFTLGYVCGLLHNLFGSNLFEERSEK